VTLGVLGGSYKSWIENQVRLRAQLLKVRALIYKVKSHGSQESQRNMEIFTKVDHDVAVLSIAPS